jgi:mycoredoxin
MLILIYENASNLDYYEEYFVQQFSANSSANEQTIKMYVTTWCGGCRMAKRWFDAHGVPYEYINIEEDDKAAEYVARVNRGYRSVPTIVFPDGSILVEPTPRELASKFSG